MARTFVLPPTSAAPSRTSRCSTTSRARLTFGKALSTPQHLVEGITAAVEKAGSDYRSAGLFLHGSTIAINTILERTGARTALIITEGFRDIYEIGRINRPDAYNLFFQKHSRWSSARCASRCRSACSPTARSTVRSTRRRSRRSAVRWPGRGIEAAAILFLNCYARADHEARAKAILETNHPEMFVSASHELSQEYREFERCSTVVANAYVGPIVRRYIGEIGDHIHDAGFRRLVPDRAVDRRPLRGRAGAEPMHPACWNPVPRPA